jgi:hypothetical protein
VSKFADQQSRRSYATPQDSSQLKEYAFEMAASSIRFGPGVTQEVGMDLKNMNAKRVCVVTDETVDKLDAMKQVREALTREGIDFRVFNKTRVEPKDSSSVPNISQVCYSVMVTNRGPGSRKPSPGPSPTTPTASWLSEAAR